MDKGNQVYCDVICGSGGKGKKGQNTTQNRLKASDVLCTLNFLSEK